VIKLNPWSTVNLNEILSIHTTDTYKAVYPNVKKYSEQDMLFVKQALDRFKKFHNTAHREAITKLANKMAHQLDLAEEPENKVEFLRTLLNDYVVLSR
jgi:predicted unusual protein kinase regulating ubiquinone biosynthesis (AarF/ABC1/UbiB family)